MFGSPRSLLRRLRLLLPSLLLTAALAGCVVNPNDLPVPGAAGTGSGSYEITAMVPAATGLVHNAPILMNDVTVGSVGRIEVKDWNAEITMRLERGVEVPVGSHVMVGMTSVLGSTHLQIVEPEDTSAGFMTAGESIPMVSCPEQDNVPSADPANPQPDLTEAQRIEACNYPTTEQVLSSLSVVLNGGGLTQLGDVISEVNAIFTDPGDPETGEPTPRQSVANLIPELSELIADLDAQKFNIIRAMEGVERLSATLNEQKPTIERALASGPDILGLLVNQRQNLTDALEAVGDLSRTANEVLDANSEDIETIVANIAPLLEQLSQTGPALTNSLRIMLTFPFPQEVIQQLVRGDYINSDLVLDLTFQRLNETLITSLGINGPEGILGASAGNAARGLNPFTSPITPGGASPGHQDPANPRPYLPGGAG